MSGASAEVVSLAEHLQVPVCTTYLHNDAFPASHSLWMGPLGYQVSFEDNKTIWRRRKKKKNNGATAATCSALI